MGANVGFRVGDIVTGACEGAPGIYAVVGTKVSAWVGCNVGNAVGVSVGANVGFGVGT